MSNVEKTAERRKELQCRIHPTVLGLLKQITVTGKENHLLPSLCRIIRKKLQPILCSALIILFKDIIQHHRQMTVFITRQQFYNSKSQCKVYLIYRTIAQIASVTIVHVILC